MQYHIIEWRVIINDLIEIHRFVVKLFALIYNQKVFHHRSRNPFSVVCGIGFPYFGGVMNGNAFIEIQKRSVMAV